MPRFHFPRPRYGPEISGESCPLAEEELIKIGAVNLRVAHGACLVLRILRVETRQLGHVAPSGWRMTLQAKNVHLADAQQSRVS